MTQTAPLCKPNWQTRFRLVNLLALDTSTEACSAALLRGGQTAAREEIAPRRHGELILPMIDGLLAEAGLALGRLDAIAFGRGPGAFAGVRIAAGVTQGLAYAADLPVIAVSSLAALAQAAADRGGDSVFAAIDARLGEIYCCQYRIAAGLARPMAVEQVIKPQQVEVDTSLPIFGIGSGWEAYHDILLQKCGDRLSGHKARAYPSAAHILQLAIPEYQAGNLHPPQEAVPVYLRNRVTD